MRTNLDGCRVIDRYEVFLTRGDEMRHLLSDIIEDPPLSNEPSKSKW
jgi:hypothetical protein